MEKVIDLVHRFDCFGSLSAEEIAAFAASLGWDVAGIIPSPIEGGEGNKEFLLHAYH